MKIFEMNDCDWWMAPTLEEAIQDSKGYYGNNPENWEEAREITEEEMDRLKYVDNDEHGNEVKRTFREELKRRIAAGAKTELFASTEY